MVGGGPSAKWRHRGCGMAPGKTAGTGWSLAPCFMQIPASESLLFFLRRGKFWPDLEKWLNPRACDRMGVVGGRGFCYFCSLWGEATMLHSSGVIPCACSKLCWDYLA